MKRNRTDTLNQIKKHLSMKYVIQQKCLLKKKFYNV